MSHKQSSTAWWTTLKQPASGPDFYNELAEWCEKLGPTEQRRGFERIFRELAEFGELEEDAQKEVANQWISMLAESGAFESAAVAMIPPSATFSGGRARDGSFVAQVIPEGSAGAHSRKANSLSMAWLAALLRSFARQSAEAMGASTH